MKSLGEKFKEKRESKDLSIKQVSEDTKIRSHILKAIEEDNYSILPKVYLKSFLLAYSKYLNIPTSDIQENLDEIFKEAPKKEEPEKEETESEEKKTKEKKKIFNELNLAREKKTKILNILAYALVACVLIIIVYFSFYSNNNFSEEKEKEIAKKDAPIADTNAIRPKEKNVFSFLEEPDSVILRAEANDSAWVKITIDDKISEQIFLTPEMEKRWAAKDHFILTLGNAGAVKLTRNGEPLKSLGPRGSVVRNVKITSNDIVNSSDPWKNRRRYKRKKEEDIDPKELFKPSTIDNPAKDILKNLSDKEKNKRKKQSEKEKKTPKQQKDKNSAN